jgi:hypothetical protein
MKKSKPMPKKSGKKKDCLVNHQVLIQSLANAGLLYFKEIL